MYSNEDLETAVAAGAISGEAAAALRLHVEARRRTPAADEEHFRLVTGFNDVFVVVAGALLLAAVGGLGAALNPAFAGVLVALTAWTLAEYFVRHRRMALPAIVLLAAFVGGVFFAAIYLASPLTDPLPLGLAAALSALAAWTHWRRFRVPITVAAGAAAVSLVVAALLAATVPTIHAWWPVVLFASGTAVFALALWWDSSDTDRTSGRSDTAFWLHLLAAPMMVHPVFVYLGSPASELGAGHAAIVLAVYAAIALVSLWIDRRALMVSALGYVLFTLTALLRDSGIVELNFAVVGLVVGSALLLLSAFWQRSRAAVLPLLPQPLRRHLPPLRG